MRKGRPVIFAFGACELDLQRYELRRDGAPRKIEPQVFDVLALLVRERARVVAKEEILDAVWGSRFVSESTLTSRIKALRSTLGDDGRTQRYIRTVHGRGYQFVADVEERPSPASSARPPVHMPSQAIRFCTGQGVTTLPLYDSASTPP